MSEDIESIVEEKGTDVKLLIKLINHDQGERKSWADNQVSFHDLRYNGLSRAQREPWQTDLAYMHADAAIENLKPQYIGHIYNSELLADYTSSEEAVDPSLNLLRSQWFDYELRNNSNFDEEMLAILDISLQSGFGFVRVFYNDNDEIEFQSLRPLDVVVPVGTKKLKNATRVAVKMRMSPIEYALDDRFEVRDEQSIKKMMGKGKTSSSSEQGDLVDQKNLDLGVDEHTGRIEIWEVYMRDRDGWVLHTISENLPDQALRKPVRLPYVFRGRPILPIVHFPFEIVDVGGIYDSRGLPQKLWADEAELTTIRNLSLDAVKVCGTPIFENAQGFGNSTNFRFKPLAVLPQGLTQKNIQFPNVNFQLAENNILSRSERRITSPDYSVRQMSNGSDRRTAYEVQSINSLTMQSTNMRFKILRIALAELYRVADTILCFHRDDDEQFVINGKRVILPRDSKKKEFNIVPAGAEELWNKERRTQQAMQVWQQFNGQPWFDSQGFGKYTLTTIEPRFASKFVVDTGLKTQTERVKQLQENLLLERGEIVPITLGDDHATHAMTTYEAIAKAAMNNVNMNPQQSQAFVQHLQQHLEALKQADPQAHKKVTEQIDNIKNSIMQQVQARQIQQQRQEMQAPTLSNNIPQ